MRGKTCKHSGSSHRRRKLVISVPSSGHAWTREDQASPCVSYTDLSGLVQVEPSQGMRRGQSALVLAAEASESLFEETQADRTRSPRRGGSSLRGDAAMQEPTRFPQANIHASSSARNSTGTHHGGHGPRQLAQARHARPKHTSPGLRHRLHAKPFVNASDASNDEAGNSNRNTREYTSTRTDGLSCPASGATDGSEDAEMMSERQVDQGRRTCDLTGAGAPRGFAVNSAMQL
ncbi:unnamed protein product [Pedinophyceae sp. YPF-701]|nr:unnamed protein product [Pedinophyceae sp. YPF-701]